MGVLLMYCREPQFDGKSTSFKAAHPAAFASTDKRLYGRTHAGNGSHEEPGLSVDLQHLCGILFAVVPDSREWEEGSEVPMAFQSHCCDHNQTDDSRKNGHKDPHDGIFHGDI